MEWEAGCSRGEEGLRKRLVEMVMKHAPELGGKIKPERETFSSLSGKYKFLNDSREGVLGEIDVSDVKREGAEDLLFSDGILEEIEKQRERIMEEVGELVERRERCRKEGQEEPTVEGILRLLQRAILDLEKLRVEVGMESIEECKEILFRLDGVRDRIRKSVSAGERKKRTAWLLLFLVAPSLLAVFFKRCSGQAAYFFSKIFSS